MGHTNSERGEDMTRMLRTSAAGLVVLGLVAMAPRSAGALCWYWWNGCSYTKTNYPIVLAHGMAGTTTALCAKQSMPTRP